MSLSRILVAGSLMAVLALAGCSAEGEAPEESPAPTETAAAAPKADLDGLPDVIAVVNDEEIDLDEFTKAYEPQFQQAVSTQQQSGQEVDQDQLKKQIADQLVNNHLLTQAAAESGIEASDEDVDSVLQDVADQAGLESIDDVVDAFGDQGYSEDDVREDAESQFLIDSYVDAETDVEPPSDKELRKQYDAAVEQAKTQGGESEIPPFEEVKQQLSDQAVAQQQNAEIQDIVEQLRKKADVSIKI